MVVLNAHSTHALNSINDAHDRIGGGATRDGWARIMDRAWALKLARDALVHEVMNHPNREALNHLTHTDSAPASSEGGATKNKVPVFRPRMDLYDDPASTQISAALELPGLKRESIKVIVQDQFLLVSGERKPLRRPHSSPTPTPTRANTLSKADYEGDGMVVDSDMGIGGDPGRRGSGGSQQTTPPPSTTTSTARRPATPYDPIADARSQSQPQYPAHSNSPTYSPSQSQYRSLAHVRSNSGSRFVTSSEREDRSHSPGSVRERERSYSPLTGHHSQPLSQSYSQSQFQPQSQSNKFPYPIDTEPHSPSVATQPEVEMEETQADMATPTGPTRRSSASASLANATYANNANANSAPRGATALPVLTPARKEAQHIVREFKFGRFQRVIALGPGVQVSDIAATLDDGILTITWPRPPAHVVHAVPETQVKVESQSMGYPV